MLAWVLLACDNMAAPAPSNGLQTGDGTEQAQSALATGGNGEGQARPALVTGEVDEGELVQIAYVRDGDTVDLLDGRRVRYLGINAPEYGQPFFEEARAANRRLAEGQTGRLVLDVQHTDRFGRTLAYLWVNDQFVNLELVRQGYANAYTEPPNVQHSAKILAAQKEARDSQAGLWAPSDIPVRVDGIYYDAPGLDHQNPNGEWVVLRNEGTEAISLAGFTISDTANHLYSFPAIVLEDGGMVELHSGQGQDGNGLLYWGLAGTAVWNNDGDSAFLRDPEGRLVDYYAY